MLGRQSVRVTYAHKKRRLQGVTRKKLMSSPLEVLPPEMDDLTRSQMARRMLKRSRRTALIEKLEDKNVEHIREHLAKRIKCTQERASNTLLNDVTFQTPFPSPPVHDSADPLVPEQFSPVPISRRIMSRTSSRDLKENGAHPQLLASPFNSRPGSAVSSPKHKCKGRSSRHAKSRTISGVFKENIRRVSWKDSTTSLKDASRGPPPRRIKHQRCPSSPSTSYMRSQSVQEGWIVPLKALSRTSDDYDNNIFSPSESVRSNASFYKDQPRFCSTPTKSRSQAADLAGHTTRSDDLLASSSLPEDPTENVGVDVGMADDTILRRRQTIHLSGNSIFSSSDEFTINSVPAVNNSKPRTGRDEAPPRVPRQSATYRGVTNRSSLIQSLAGSFVAEYDISLPSSPTSTAITKMIDADGVPKSVGERSFGLSGTSPAHCGNLMICRSKRAPLALPRTLVSCPPSSLSSDLALEFGSMCIRGEPVVYSDGETHCPSGSIALPMPSYSLQEVLTESNAKKPGKRRSARNRAGTIRGSDFVKPGASSSIIVPGSTASQPNVRRTRSGTIVGPDSKLATKSAGLPNRTTRVGLVTVLSGPKSESDDELLLRDFCTEDLVYLGRPVPPDREEAEADELNLGGLWYCLESGHPAEQG